MRGVNPASLAQKTMKNPNHNSTQGTPRIGFSAVLGRSLRNTTIAPTLESPTKTLRMQNAANATSLEVAG
jgi:hypothetical protein